ncbi:hypothetical protein [Streptomyces sp. NPDC058305]|uniref:hypothetical protein n=1 Tax=Streptomyces sp. NPDC058305 TaxID=3346438 RepID=UPI0036E2F755
MSQQLNTLLRENLVDFAVLPQPYRSCVWYLTPMAARLTRGTGRAARPPVLPDHLRHRGVAETPHTLTVVRTHPVFVADARQRWDWTRSVIRSSTWGQMEGFSAPSLPSAAGAAVTSTGTWTGPRRCFT